MHWKIQYAKSLKLFSSQITIVCVSYLWWCIAFAIHNIRTKEWWKRTRPFVPNHISTPVCFHILSHHSLDLYGFRGTVSIVLSEHQMSAKRRQLERHREQNNEMRMCERDKRFIWFKWNETKKQTTIPFNFSNELIHRVTWMRRSIAIYTVMSCPFFMIWRVTTKIVEIHYVWVVSKVCSLFSLIFI